MVLGAGLAGLSAALHMKKGVRILEKRPEPGGLCDTVIDEGFRFDRTGHLLHLSDPRARKMVLGFLRGDLVRIERRSRIFSHGVYTHYPFQANLHGLPPRIVAECLESFVEAYAARGGERIDGDNFEDFIRANFGDGIARNFMIPYNRKLWGVHPREITSRWCDRFVPTPSLREVVAGTVGMPQGKLGYNASFLYPTLGVGSLSRAMADKVGEIEYRTAPTAIDFKRRRVRVRGNWEPYTALVSSIPLDRLCSLLVEPPAAIRDWAASLRCTRLRYLDVALERRPGTEYHWSYVPENKYPFYRVGSYSNFSPRMAPRGKGNLYVELASRGALKMDSLMPRVVSGLVEMGIIRRASDIRFARPRLIDRAYVVYDQSREAASRGILSWLESRDILSIGRYGRWEYAAMENAMVQGMEAAEQALSM